MYLFPPHEARDALAEENALRMRALGDTNGVDPIASFFSDLFGGNPDSTSTTKTSTTARSSSTTPLIPLVPTSTSTSSRTTSTSSSRSTHSTAHASVITTPPPNLTSTAPSSTLTITSTASNNNANNAATAPSTKSGLPSVVIGVIVAASVIFGLIFLSLITRKILQSRRRARRNTWARGSVIAPFAPPTVFKEKDLPPPPAETTQPEYPSYPAYPPPAVSYANPAPYSPAAPSSAGYPAPYPFGGTGNTPMLQTNQNQLFNSSAYSPADLAGPVVIQQTPPTPLTATAPSGPISVVKRTFVPSLPDELSISNGDQVRVISSYDDGWALCEKVSTGEKGVVPQECLEEAKGAATSNTPGQQIVGNDSAARLNRASSLRREQDKTY